MTALIFTFSNTGEIAAWAGALSVDGATSFRRCLRPPLSSTTSCSEDAS